MIFVGVTLLIQMKEETFLVHTTFISIFSIKKSFND